MMADKNDAIVPVWTLATGDAALPEMPATGPITVERLSELRTVLAALADHPVATLEVHPLPDRFDRSHGIPLDAASPLAQHLSQLIAQTAQGTPVKAEGSGEALYRMVVPAKVADKFAPGVDRKSVAAGKH